MSTISDFSDFSDGLRERCRDIRRAVDEQPVRRASVTDPSSLLETTIEHLDAAAEELRMQNDALFAAQTEMEAAGQFYRDLFDLAPAGFLVTTPDGQITHVNRAATYLFGRPANALVSRLVVSFVDQEERRVFRSALTRVQTAPWVEEWPIRMLCRHAAPSECRVRVSAQHEGDCVRALQWIITEEGASDDLL